MALSEEYDALIYTLRPIITDRLNALTRDMFAALAPAPTKEQIESESRQDRLKNPHNDSYKPRLRDYGEVIADIRYRHADYMMAARLKREKV